MSTPPLGRNTIPAKRKAASSASIVTPRGCAQPRSKSLIARREAPDFLASSACVQSRSARPAAHWFFVNRCCIAPPFVYLCAFTLILSREIAQLCQLPALIVMAATFHVIRCVSALYAQDFKRALLSYANGIAIVKPMDCRDGSAMPTISGCAFNSPCRAKLGRKIARIEISGCRLRLSLQAYKPSSTGFLTHS